jgi:hypothetical protein
MAHLGDGRYNSEAPPRLIGFAKEAKAKIDATFTKSFDNQPRQETELPVLPPYTSREAFNKAIEELRRVIGQENVELNDQV